MGLSDFISKLDPNLFGDDFGVEVYKQANSLPLLYIGIVLFGPLFEEFLFRGFLFKGLANSFLGGHGTVFFTSFLFTIIHLQYLEKPLVLLFILFPMALILGYARLSSKSLLLPILLHSINNLGTCVFIHFEIY